MLNRVSLASVKEGTIVMAREKAARTSEVANFNFQNLRHCLPLGLLRKKVLKVRKYEKHKTSFARLRCSVKGDNLRILTCLESKFGLNQNQEISFTRNVS